MLRQKELPAHRSHSFPAWLDVLAKYCNMSGSCNQRLLTLLDAVSRQVQVPNKWIPGTKMFMLCMTKWSKTVFSQSELQQAAKCTLQALHALSDLSNTNTTKESTLLVSPSHQFACPHLSTVELMSSNLRCSPTTHNFS